jgi:hypothetical protein
MSHPTELRLEGELLTKWGKFARKQEITDARKTTNNVAKV